MVLRQVHRLCKSPWKVEISRFHQYYRSGLPGPTAEPDEKFRSWWSSLKYNTDRALWIFGWRSPDQAAKYCGTLNDVWRGRYANLSEYPDHFSGSLHKFALLPQYVRAGETQVVFVKDRIILREEAS